MKFNEKKITDTCFEYRGNSCYRNIDIAENGYGAWFCTGGPRLAAKAQTLEGLKAIIDNRLATSS